MVQEISGWGRVIRVAAEERVSEDLALITRDAVLTRGLGRSYGDASLPPASGLVVANSRLANRLLAFDASTGELTVEAGVSLHDINRVFLPRGWASPVSPGTQFVTVGGMVAADVHGKNHHREGSFGRHVRWLRLRLASGQIAECTPDEEAGLFWATVGGMGLTGHILEVRFAMERIPSPWIWQEVRQIASLETMLTQLREEGVRWPFTVAWVDLLARGSLFGRSVLICGRWADVSEARHPYRPVTRRRRVPVDVPEFVLNPALMRLYNASHHRTCRGSRGVVHPETFFYPLDTLADWNRMYGKRGFIQYQCVIPSSQPVSRLLEFFDLVRSLPLPVYLCVFKDFGAPGDGLISFPAPGFTVAMDLPNRPPHTQVAVDRLNEFVLSVGGRVYLAKDAHTRPEHFRAMEPRLAAFNEARRRWDPEGRLRSALSVRLMGDRP